MRRIGGQSHWRRLPVTSEQAFVLAIAAAFAFEEEPQSTLETLSEIVPHISSWQNVDLLLGAHRCTALAYAVLRQPAIRAAAVVPNDFFVQKRDWYSSSFVRVASEPIVLHRILNAFEQVNIPALAIKGLALGTWLYGDPVLREHDDIDLLVPADMQDPAHSILIELGYRQGYQPPLYPGELMTTASYLDPDGGISVDLSFDPVHVFWQSNEERRRAFEGWWSRRQYVQIGKRAVPVPGPEDQFIQLARHLQFHGYFRVNWWIDLLLLLRGFGGELGWHAIGREAARLGIKGGLFRTLELAQVAYGARVPSVAIAELDPGRAIRVLHRRVWPDVLVVPRERPLRDQEGTPIAPRFLSPRGVHPVAGLSIFMLDSKRNHHIRYLVQRIVPPAIWLRDIYGPGSYPVLLTRHWQGLRVLRQQVQRRTKRPPGEESRTL